MDYCPRCATTYADRDVACSRCGAQRVAVATGYGSTASAGVGSNAGWAAPPAPPAPNYPAGGYSQPGYGSTASAGVGSNAGWAAPPAPSYPAGGYSQPGYVLPQPPPASPPGGYVQPQASPAYSPGGYVPPQPPPPYSQSGYPAYPGYPAAGPAPQQPGVGRQSSPSDTTTALWTHLGSLLVTLFVGFGFVVPLVIMLDAGKRSPFVRAHAAEALNHYITGLLVFVAVGLTYWMILPLLVGLAYAVFWIVSAIRASSAASAGRSFAYPLTLRLVR